MYNKFKKRRGIDQMKKWILLFVVFLFVPKNADASMPQLNDNNSYATYSTVQQLAENDNDPEIQYWLYKLEQAKEDLRDAERDYESAVHNNTGVLVCAQRVQICRQSVEFCKQQLRNRGYNIY